ncbi:DDB1- and CUL4-associated factor 8 isoform X2 [Calliopsis andreniformis]|uniref:DDB1- and CUL4-associated factor 8 isoform X2 n=1 Tax=Calliopsis andreniformis TaxID=337506 RepID=UPI003FCC9B82
MESKEKLPECLEKEKPKPNWFVVPELLSREVGNNPLFRRRYYGSLHVVERFELMYKLKEHNGCVNALNFNQKGNLLASGSDDLDVVIWDWAIRKKLHVYDSGHKSNVFQTKWLPFDVEYLMATCAHNGEIRLLDVRQGISRQIAMHSEQIHRLAIHMDTPHIIISAGEDAKVLSIDIRERKPTKLLVVQDETSKVRLYSVHSNPLNSNEFCVAGQSHLVRVYDRRKPSAALHTFAPEHLMGDKHITCAVYNYNGTEILASYKDESIYLFDTVSPQLGDYAHRYQGHRNNLTVKGVNFFGPKSEYIISGSDCGNIFVWDKNTEAIVNWMEGDEKAVNCLEPHPRFPILATSGLDYDVKIWVPSCQRPPDMEDLESCVKFNAKYNVIGSSVFSAFSSQMFWLFLASTLQSEDDDDNDDEDDQC